MYSKIFQLEEIPISESKYITGLAAEHDYFIGSIADSVERTSREDAINNLKLLSEFGVQVDSNMNGTFLRVTDKEEYFKWDYRLYQKRLKKALNLSFEDFCRTDKADNDIYDICSIYEDKFEDYVLFDGILCTFRYFIRTRDLNRKYYIGGVLKYHY